MFVNKNQLEHLLKPDHYTSEDFFQKELTCLFLPGWHLVGAKGELAKPGSFITAELFDTPVIIYNFDGDLAAFLNVCSHRHCLINSERSGCMKNFKCQYHGWEYKADGSTGRIPEANCFRPFDRENARLKKFPIATCGDLVFVSFAEDPPPIEEFIGDSFDEIAERFCEPSRFAMSWDYHYGTNWKVPVENTLEAYHIPELHPTSFLGVYPGEDYSTHILDEKFTRLEYNMREYWLVYRLLRRGALLLGAKLTNTYIHHHIHPNFVVIFVDLHAYAFSYIPVTAGTSKVRLVTYCFRGKRKNPISWITWLISRFFGKRSVLKIALEDAAIFADQQRGLEKSPHPGVIGTLEERLYCFQKYVLEKCGEATE
ncbi:MAG: aromatic ring-hydroxylating dioxygenase subunit alpha [Verrucomicrobiales bacterium]|nr:aromatic ring-hydroxylating dioxygenase subunit alpha [Verrucomicrobiales bacterium]